MIIAVVVIMIIAVVVIMIIAVVVIMIVVMVTVIVTVERHAKSAFDVRVRNTKMTPVPSLG